MLSLYLFMTALFAALIMIPFLRRWALDRHVVDQPDHRKIHLDSMPRLGGIAIFMSFLFAMLTYAEISPQIRGLLAGGIVVFLTGLVDDLSGLSPRSKLYGQIGGATVAVLVGDILVTDLGNLIGTGALILPLWLAYPFTIIAMVGLINAINLIDGLDGLAGGISLIALCVFFLLGLYDNNTTVILVSAAMMGAVLGFLKYNFYPARIFMGDAGSLALGFVLAYLAVSLTQSPQSTISPMIPVLVLGMPILDTLWVMFRRMQNGLNPFSPDKTHVHHKFLDLGFQHRFTVIIIYGHTIFWSCFGMALRHAPEYLLLISFLLLSASMYGGLRYLLNRPEQFAFLQKDSMLTVRESGKFKRIVGWTDRFVPLLTVPIMGYLAIAALLGGAHGRVPWAIGGLMFFLLLSMLLLKKGLREQGLLGILYLVGLYIVTAVELKQDWVVFLNVDVGLLGGLFLGVMMAMVLVKLLFRRDNEFFVSTVEVFVLGLSILLAMFIHSYSDLFGPPAVVAKAIFLYLAMKMIVAHGGRSANIVVAGMFFVLLMITLRSYLAV